MRDIDAAADPHVIAPLDVVEESLERAHAPGPSDEPAVQPDRHHPRARGRLGVEDVERVAHVLEPLATGVGAGGFLAFMASFDNVPVSLFRSDARTEVLPIHLWQIIETDLDVRAAAASGVLIVLTLLVMLAAERLAGLSRQLR